MVDAGFLERWVSRFRREIPGAVAVVLKGSHVRGNAGPHSDVDFDVLVRNVPIANPYPAWFEAMEDGRLLHISVAVDHVEDWLRAFDEPAKWAFGFPSREVTKLLWAESPALHARLDRPWRDHPAAKPELEDFVEELGKARNARLRGDDLAMRLALQELATLSPTLLAPLNTPAVPGTRPEALEAALDLTVAPGGYRRDMLACMGLDGESHSAHDALAAGERLVFGTLALLEANADAMSPPLSADWGDHVKSGILRRYLEQGHTSGAREGTAS